MTFLLFVLEILPVVAGIAPVPTRSELRICRPRGIYDEREQGGFQRPRNISWARGSNQESVLHGRAIHPNRFRNDRYGALRD